MSASVPDGDDDDICLWIVNPFMSLNLLHNAEYDVGWW